ncbi:MAG: L-glutamate gamma-semialdehyde dehydrogenase [Planctomycetota bacterium]
MAEAFQNEALTDFGDPDNRALFERALQGARDGFGRRYSCWIGGREVPGGKDLLSRDPGRLDEVIGICPSLSENDAEAAMQAALAAFPDWAARSAAERAEFLFKAADLMRERKHDLSATMVYEVGKSWAEADADTAEAIDFLSFYAGEALRYAERQPITPVAGEKNELVYIPLGVGVVIPPWNFPLAILAGMTTAALVAGNTVILKPASDSPVIGCKFADIMREVGIPDGVLNYVSGSGAVVGDCLVRHPKTRFISFTGSMEVGLGINEKAARGGDGQIWIKRVIAEMGGKDSIYVDSEVDLDSAVQATLASAFGYSGQKCSACSRAIVHCDIYDSFIDKLVTATNQIRVGHPEDPEVFMGPVSSESALQKVLDYIDIGKGEGRLVAGGERGDQAGYYVQPTIFADVGPEARLAQEEIFGPVLAIIKAKDFEDGRRIFNNTIYGLTGSIFSSDRAHLEQAKRSFHVGNLYLNRKCTGAFVGGHPFGGFNMSGTDSKAGGRDYLLLLTQAKTISEKV